MPANGLSPIEVAERSVDIFIEQTDAQIIEITAEIGRNAVQAFNTFGRGRHKAGLNMGDCFAYACAKAHDLPLLFKGNDFPYTDIEDRLKIRADGVVLPSSERQAGLRQPRNSHRRRLDTQAATHRGSGLRSAR